MATAPDLAADTAAITFSAGDLSADDLRVTQLAGNEGISSLFHFRLQLCSRRDDIAAEDVLGRPGVVEIEGAAGTRYVNGIVRRFECSGQGTSVTYYSAEIVPLHWLLTRRRRSRIFQECNCEDMTVGGIIRKVLEDAGVPEDAYRFALERTDYPTHEYVVQYRESEFDFISRLMEAEGIFYFFEHTADEHTMVIADSGVAHADTPGDTSYPFHELSGMLSEEGQEYVYRVSDSEQIHFGAVSLDEFDFTRPPLQLRTEAESDDNTSLRFVDYPGDYADREQGQQLTQVRLEELRSATRMLRMSTTARGMLPGFRFTLTGHPREALNREYVVTKLATRASQPQSGEENELLAEAPQHEVELHAIPSDVPFRPPRVTPRPTVRGSQTAIVVGPSDEEIYTDRYGRVKVQFHWDQEGVYDENSSCWIRVSQGSAGGQYGMMFLPRVGQEVVVDFLEGDPDRPIITGRVYNGDHMPPYTLPDEKTKSCIKTNSSKGGGGTNEIRFEDKKGSEQVLVYAQGGLHIRANGDRVENIGKDRHLTVKENRYDFVKMNAEREVKLDLTEKVGGKKSLKVVGDVAEDFSENHTEKVGINHYLSAGTNVVIEAGTNITLKVGGNSIAVTTAGIFLCGTSVYINSGSGATTGTSVALKTPEAPHDAASAVPGHDTSYSAEAEETEPEDSEERETSWVEIEMTDEAGAPWAGEAYEIHVSEDDIRRGNLDENGQAHVLLPENAEVDVAFPRLDADAWEKIE